jgi:hypothetical protein
MPLAYVDSLGLCEHCQTLLSLESMPGDAINGDWKCPSCKGILTHRSFGYESEQGHKVQWVGPRKKWLSRKPQKDFRIGKLEVAVSRPMVFW